MSQLVVRELSRSLLKASGKAVSCSKNHPAYRRAELAKFIRTYMTEARPVQMPMGFVKVAVFGASVVYAGGMLAKNGAAFLEENEIFVPSEGDDAFE